MIPVRNDGSSEGVVKRGGRGPRRMARAAAFTAAIWLLSFAVQGEGTGSTAPRRDSPGRIVCAGAETMRDLAEAWGRLLHARVPAFELRVLADRHLAGDGFDALMQGQADCALFVREPFPAEIDAFTAKFGYPPLAINVAGGSYATKGGTHAIAIYVNAANPLHQLDLVQLDAVLSKTLHRGAPRTITAWGQLGAGGEWAEKPVHVYGMITKRASGNPPGIVNFLTRRVLLDGVFRGDVREQIDRPGESALEAIVNRVAEDAVGIGYSGFGYARPGVRVLALAETSRAMFYLGRRDEVESGLYPLSRRIYFLVNRPPGQPLSPALDAFVRLALSREGQDLVRADRMGFVPLTLEQASAEEELR